MKTVLIASAFVLMSLLSSLFPSIGDLNIAELEKPKSVIIVTGDNDLAVTENISTYLRENYSSVTETAVTDGDRIDTVYSFPSRIFGDRNLSKLLATSRCVYFYKAPLQIGTPTSFCGLVGNTYTYHLAGSSLDNVFLSFKGNGGSYVNVFNTDNGSYCSSSLGWLATSTDWKLTMNFKISCLVVYH